jgi:hypothetical protein
VGPGGNRGHARRRMKSAASATRAAKLSNKEARAILADTRPTAEVAAEYGVSISHISNIRHRKAVGAPAA